MNVAAAFPFILLTVLFGTIAYVCLFDKAVLWRWQELGNRSRGIGMSQRTVEWEWTMSLVGYLVGGIALFTLLASIVSLTEPTIEERLAPLRQPLGVPSASHNERFH